MIDFCRRHPSHNNILCEYVLSLLFSSCCNLETTASFDFNDKDSLFISENIEQLTKIMLPSKTQMQVDAINTIAKEIYQIAEKHLVASVFYAILEKTLSEKHRVNAKEILSLIVIINYHCTPP